MHGDSATRLAELMSLVWLRIIDKREGVQFMESVFLSEALYSPDSSLICGSRADILLIIVLLNPETIAIEAIIIMMASIIPDVAIFREKAAEPVLLSLLYN